MENFFIIDGNSLINRAFYALPLLTNSEGEFSNAIYGFCNILIKLISENNARKIVVAFDLKEKTFRHKMFDAYKAGRQAMPEELASQMPLLKQMLSLMNIPIIEKAGFEADDIIGTLSKNKATKNFIITGDKDSLQLIDDNTEVWLTRKGLSEIEQFDKQHLFEVYNLSPSQIVDLKALMGDSSDNIPGVRGVGEKTALSLLKDYGTIENLYNNIDKIKGKLQEKLIDGKEMCFLSKTLATIITDVEFDFDVEKVNIKFPFDEKTANFFEKYQFKTILKKQELFNFELVEKKVEKKQAIEKIISSEEDLSKLILDLKNNNPFSFVLSSNIHISNSKYQENVIKIKENLIDDGLDFMLVIKSFKELLEDENVKKIVFDKKQLMHNLCSFGINLRGVIFDVMLADYLVKSGKKSIKNEEELCNQQNYVSLCVATCLFESYKTYLSKLKDLDMEFLYNNIEFPLIDVLFSMEQCGFKLDHIILKKLCDEYNDELKDLVEKIKLCAGEDFNVNSPKQLAHILFDKLGLKNIEKNSTKNEVLESLRNAHPIIEHIIRYRKISKLNSSYVESYLEKIDDKSHLVHTIFNQMLTQTGRLSSQEPNLQNIPIREEEGRKLRKIFISRFQNGKLTSADYSQIELRLLAGFSGDERLVDAFNHDLDIHEIVASQIFNVPQSLISPQMRRRAKAVNFGIVYGISDYGLSQSIHSTRKEAKEFIEKYFESYPGVKKYLESSIVFAKENGYVKTMFNRRRIIDELNSNNYNLKQFGERVALNMPLQGTASDIIKLAMIEVFKEFKKRKLNSKLILQIHDELICDTFPGEEEIVKHILKEKMENVVSLSVPLKVNISEGENLYDAKD